MYTNTNSISPKSRARALVWMPFSSTREGARFDLAVKGRGKGRLCGRTASTISEIRADGRIELDLHVTIETGDGSRIALSGDGQAAPPDGEPLLDIFANIRLFGRHS